MDSETSERKQDKAGARSGGTDDAGTPETTMAPPRPPQRTPVNPYRVVLRDSNTPRPNYVLMLTPELKVGAVDWWVWTGWVAGWWGRSVMT